MVSPAGRGRILTRLWPKVFLTLFRVCLAPEGSWYPWAAPWIFLGGYKGPGCRGRAEGRGHGHGHEGPPALASWAPCSTLASVCLFRSGGPVLCMSLSVLRGLQSAHPPSLVVLLRRGTRLPGGGSYVRPLSCVSCVPASCFLIWLVSCPHFMSLLVNSVPGVCVWLCVYYPVYLSPVCWVPCRLVYSLFPVFLCVCIALSYLDVVIKDYYFEVYPRLRVPRFSLLCAPWQLGGNKKTNRIAVNAKIICNAEITRKYNCIN